MKRIVLFLSSIYLPFMLAAQQDVLYSQYMFGSTMVNPAAAGSRRGIDATLFFKNQFNGLRGAPEARSFQIASPLKHGQLGAGFEIGQQEAAGTNTFKSMLHMNYKINAFGGVLAFGVSSGLRHYKVDFNYLNIMDYSDHVITSGSSALIPDFGAGIHFNKKRYYLGLATQHLNQSSLRLGSFENSQAKLRRHYYLLGAYKASLSNSINWKPSMLIKYVPSSAFQVDFSSHIDYKNKIWAGCSYRTNHELALQLGGDLGAVSNRIIHSIYIGYAYELPLGLTQKISLNTQEVFLALRYVPRPALSKLKKRNVVESPVIF